MVTRVFRPLKDFEANVARKAKKEEVSVHEGARGVMRNSSHGCPDGCAQIYAYKDRIIGERKEEGDIENQLRPGQPQSRFSQLIAEQAKASTRAKKKPALTTVAKEGSASGVSGVDVMGMALSYGKPELEDEEAPESESQNGGQLAQVQKAAGKAKAKGQDQGKGQGQGKGQDQGATRVRSMQKTKQVIITNMKQPKTQTETTTTTQHNNNIIIINSIINNNNDINDNSTTSTSTITITITTRWGEQNVE